MEDVQDSEAIFSPFDNSTVGYMPLAGEKQVEAAVQAALRAEIVMRKLPRFVRADILARTAELLKERREKAAVLIASEAGKPLYDARGEVARSIFNLTNAAAEARRFSGEEVPLDMDAEVFAYQSTAADGSRITLADTPPERLAAMRRRVGIARRFLSASSSRLHRSISAQPGSAQGRASSGRWAIR